MTRARVACWGLLAAGIAAGTLADRPALRAPLYLAGYRVLAGDFHVHPFPLSASTLAPWDLVLEARRQGLDVIAITPHNGALAGKIGRGFAAALGGPIVIPGEEIHGPRYHLIAAGIHTQIDWRLSAAEAIDDIHRQGGVAIAAHPTAWSWGAYDLATERRLDGAEVFQPIAFLPGAREQLREFFGRAPLAAIASSDYHGMGPLGLCRTYVFARDASEGAVLEAIRSHRTVVTDGDRVFGDAALARFAPQLPAPPVRPRPWGGMAGLIGLLGLVMLPRG
jgi:hypothetical protein